MNLRRVARKQCYGSMLHGTCSGHVDHTVEAATLQCAEDVHLSGVHETAVPEVVRMIRDSAPNAAVDDRLCLENYLDGRRRSPVVVLACADVYVACRGCRRSRTTAHQQTGHQRRCDDRQR